MTLQKTFGSDDSNWFCSLSGDVNPLHWDSKYATLTPLGKPVLHGMATVLAALEIWSQSLAPENGAVALHSLKVQFRKPVFWGQELIYRASKNANQKIVLEWVRGESVYSRTEIQLSEPAAARASLQPSAVFPRGDARTSTEPVVWQTESELPKFKYSIDARFLQDSRRLVGEASIPVRQLQVLTWASYFIGMEWPGASALFLDCSFEFSEFSRSDSAVPFSLDTLKSEFDSRFCIWKFNGKARDALFQLRSMERPAPVSYSRDLLSRSLPTTSAFREKQILITGGSRGFGSQLCDGLSQLGAGVWYTSRATSGNLSRDPRTPVEPVPVTADMSDLDSCFQLSENLLASGIELDVVILNASPPILANDWLEQRDQESLAFIAQTAAMVLYPLRALLPRLKKSACIIYISSEYVKKPVRHFAHYVAAKSGAEGLIRALSVEFPNYSFVIVRPPKMLTNQTNVAFDLNPPAKTELVAGQLLSELCRHESDGRSPGLIEIDLS